MNPSPVARYPKDFLVTLGSSAWDLCSVSEAAGIIGCERSQVIALIEDREIPAWLYAEKVNSFRVRRSDCLRWAKRVAAGDVELPSGRFVRYDETLRADDTPSDRMGVTEAGEHLESNTITVRALLERGSLTGEEVTDENGRKQLMLDRSSVLALADERARKLAALDARGPHVTPKEAAKMLGMSEAGFNQMISRGSIPATDVALRGMERPEWRISVADLERWFNERRY